ncbi:MAG: hypothetical protein U5K38_19840 [Woeseiaceae bacterium]|nr:hypothetical protein [Woeseiaceae bacterium]
MRMHAMPEAALPWSKRFRSDRDDFGSAVEFQQRLVDASQEANNIVLFMRFLENTDTNAAELRAPFHQRLVAEQHGLAVHARGYPSGRSLMAPAHPTVSSNKGIATSTPSFFNCSAISNDLSFRRLEFHGMKGMSFFLQ